MRKMEIQIRYTCPTCEGQGEVLSPEWATWHVQDNSESAWVDSYGAWLTAPPMPSGPEEPPCGACDGTGWQYEWKAISFALATELGLRP